MATNWDISQIDRDHQPHNASQLVQRTDLFELRLSHSPPFCMSPTIHNFISIISTADKKRTIYRQTADRQKFTTHTNTHSKQKCMIQRKSKRAEFSYDPPNRNRAFIKWILCDERHNFPVSTVLYIYLYVFYFTFFGSIVDLYIYFISPHRVHHSSYDSHWPCFLFHLEWGSENTDTNTHIIRSPSISLRITTVTILLSSCNWSFLCWFWFQFFYCIHW